MATIAGYHPSERWGAHFSTTEVFPETWVNLHFKDDGGCELHWFAHRNDAQDAEERYLRGGSISGEMRSGEGQKRSAEAAFRWGRYLFCGDPRSVKQIRSILER